MAAVDYFLKVDGIKGESLDSKHKDEIELLSWSWGATNSGDASSNSGMGSGKVTMQDFQGVMKINVASPKMIEACSTGQAIKTAELTCRKAGKDQQEYLKIKLSDLIVSSFQTGGSSSGDVVPTDHFTLNYSKVEYSYAKQKDDNTLDGPIKTGWDLKAHKKV